MAEEFEFKGGAELERALRELGDSAAVRRAGRRALREAAKPIVTDAQANVPVDKGDLRRSIKQAAGKLPRGADRDQIIQAVGIDQNVQPPKDVSRTSGRGSYRDPGVAGVGPIVEFGRPGVPAEPFLRPAFDANKHGAVETINRELWAGIEREAERLARKRGGG